MAEESVGSLVGYLRLDDASFQATADKVTRDADKLGRMKPTVTIKANADQAIAKYAEVAAAANRLQTTQEKISQSQSRYTSAQNKLAAAQTAYREALASTEGTEKQRADTITRTESAVRRATVATTTARNNLAKTSRDAQVAEIGLAAAYTKSSAAADRAATSTDHLAKSTTSAHKSVSLLKVAAVGLGPAIIPLGAVAAASFGALAEGAGAATLAIKGIQAEMKAGTVLGKAYTQSFAGLKSSVAGLERTAAVAAFPAITKGVATLHGFMPELNSETKTYTGLLGQAAVHVEHGLLSGLVAARPLTTALLGDGVKLSAAFDHFASGTGFAKFISYVQANLPAIEHGVVEVATAMEHLLEAGAGQGLSAVSAITALATAINAIPVNQLKIIVPVLTDAFLVWKGAVFITNTLKAINLGLDAYIVKAGIASKIPPPGTGGTGGKAGGTVVKDVENGVENVGGGVVTGGILSKLRVAGRGGIVGDVLGAGGVAAGTGAGLVYLGGHALSQLPNVIQHPSQYFGSGGFTPHAPSGPITSAAKFVFGPRGQANLNVPGINRAGGYGAGSYSATGADRTAALPDRTGTLSATATDRPFAAAADTAAKTAKALGLTGQAYAAASTAAAANAAQTKAATAEMQKENDAAGLLDQALGKLGNNGLGVGEAQNALAEANRAVTESFKASGSSVSLQTKKGLANREALASQAEAARSLADAVGKQTGSSVKSVASLDLSRRSLEANLKATGKLTPAVQALVDQYYDVGNLKVPPTKLDADTGPGKARIKAYQQEIDDIKQGKVPGLTANSKAGKAVIAGLQGDIDKVKQKKTPKVDADTGAATTKVRNVVQLLNGIPTIVPITVTVSGEAAAVHQLANLKAAASNAGFSVNVAQNRLNRAGGGMIPGYAPGRDSVPALLSPGEGILTPEAVRAIGGPKALYTINKSTTNRVVPKSNYMDGVAHFANGGLVGGAATIAAGLRGLGLNNIGIAGILGNLKIESNFSPSAYNPRENAHGIAQWEGGRANDDTRSNSLARQIKNLVRELTGPYSSALSAVKSAKTPSAAAAAFDRLFERSSGAARSARESAAEDIYAKLGGKSGGTVVNGITYASATSAKNAQVRAAASAAKAQAATVAGYKATGAQSANSYLTGLGISQQVANSKGDFSTALDDVAAYQKAKGGNASKAIATLRKDNLTLQAEIKTRNKLADQLANANQKLGDAKSARSDEFYGVEGAVSATANLASSGYADTFSIKTLLASKVAAAVQFGKDEKLALAHGVDPRLVRQLVEAGPDAAAVSLHTLATASRSDVKAIDKLQGQLNSTASSIGQFTAHTFFDQGVASAQGIVDGLEASEKKVNSAIAKLAAAMVKTFRKELGIASPSKVFRDHGRNLGDGLVLGIHDRLPKVQLASSRLSGAALPRSAGSSATNQPAVHVHANVQLPEKMILRVGDQEFEAQMMNIATVAAAGLHDAVTRGLRNGVAR